jgi:hypothetical protein
MLETIALYLSLIMAVYLFLYSFIEGIKMSDSEKEVSGGTFIFSMTMAFVFSGLTYLF